MATDTILGVIVGAVGGILLNFAEMPIHPSSFQRRESLKKVDYIRIN
jgi:hypothetical protein